MLSTLEFLPLNRQSESLLDAGHPSSNVLKIGFPRALKLVSMSAHVPEPPPN